MKNAGTGRAMAMDKEEEDSWEPASFNVLIATRRRGTIQFLSVAGHRLAL
jgi:hypothetical protein